MLDRPLVLGHRGASHARPENTLAAFARARELGADGVELDARRSADGWIVVHHDPAVIGFGLIAENGFTALRAAHPEIPTLVEALGACGARRARRPLVPSSSCRPSTSEPSTRASRSRPRSPPHG